MNEHKENNGNGAVSIKIEYDFDTQRIYDVVIGNNRAGESKQDLEFPKEFRNWEDFRCAVISRYNKKFILISATCRNVGPYSDISEFRCKIRDLEQEVKKGVRIVNGSIWKF